MQTKSDLLEKMLSLGACNEATEWVRAQPDDLSALRIWERCDQVEWLIWLGGRLNPHAIAAFAGRCADQARASAARADAHAAARAARAARASDASDASAAHAAAHAASDASAARAAARAAAHAAAHAASDASAASAASAAASDASAARAAARDTQLADLRSMGAEVCTSSPIETKKASSVGAPGTRLV